jgi:hypothetical protein
MNPMRLSNKELIERIAKLLPKDIAAEYYREMMYCCSLPDNDEMLKILRILQILTALIEGVPSRVTLEREAMESLFKGTASALKTVLNSSESYQQQLDDKLHRLPGEIAEGIRPRDIAKTINESLLREFNASPIPKTAASLMVVAEQLKIVHSEFSTAASKIGDAYQGSAAQAREAIARMSSQIEHSADVARSASEDLSVKFHQAYWIVLSSAAVVALLLGIVIGASYVRHFDSPKQEICKCYVAPEPEDPPVKPKRR